MENSLPVSQQLNTIIITNNYKPYIPAYIQSIYLHIKQYVNIHS